MQKSWHLPHYERLSCCLYLVYTAAHLTFLSNDSTSTIFSTENINRSNATSSLSLMTTTTLSTVPWLNCELLTSAFLATRTNVGKFISYSFCSARDVVIESRMPRLKDGRVILLATDEEFRWVYLSHVKNRMDGDLDLWWQSVNTGDRWVVVAH
jgi:hypothetical protein